MRNAKSRKLCTLDCQTTARSKSSSPLQPRAPGPLRPLTGRGDLPVTARPRASRSPVAGQSQPGCGPSAGRVAATFQSQPGCGDPRSRQLPGCGPGLGLGPIATPVAARSRPRPRPGPGSPRPSSDRDPGPGKTRDLCFPCKKLIKSLLFRVLNATIATVTHIAIRVLRDEGRRAGRTPHMRRPDERDSEERYA